MDALSKIAGFLESSFPGASVDCWRSRGDFIAVYVRIPDSEAWEMLSAVEPLLRNVSEQDVFIVVVPLPAAEPLAV